MLLLISVDAFLLIKTKQSLAKESTAPWCPASAISDVPSFVTICYATSIDIGFQVQPPWIERSNSTLK